MVTLEIKKDQDLSLDSPSNTKGKHHFHSFTKTQKYYNTEMNLGQGTSIE